MPADLPWDSQPAGSSRLTRTHRWLAPERFARSSRDKTLTSKSSIVPLNASDFIFSTLSVVPAVDPRFVAFNGRAGGQTSSICRWAFLGRSGDSDRVVLFSGPRGNR